MICYDVVNFIVYGVVKNFFFLEMCLVQGLDQLGEQVQFEQFVVVFKDEFVLVKYCVDLNKKVFKGDVDLLIGCVDEVECCIQVLCCRCKNNLLLVGDFGVGKIVIVEGLVLKIMCGEMFDVLVGLIIFLFDMGVLLVGICYCGDFEECLKVVVKEFEDYFDVILFIDEIYIVIGVGVILGGVMDVLNLLKFVLLGGKLCCMGLIIYKEFCQYFEKDRVLLCCFQKIDVNELNVFDMIKILMGLKFSFEKYYDLCYINDVIKVVVELLVCYIYDCKLFDKVIDVIDEVGVVQYLVLESKCCKIIGLKEIEVVVVKIVCIFLKNVIKDDVVVLKDMEVMLKCLVFGQDVVIEVLFFLIKLVCVGLCELEKFIGNYLFVGFIGVGKIEVVK